jgi:hypothetical protein
MSRLTVTTIGLLALATTRPVSAEPTSTPAPAPAVESTSSDLDDDVEQMVGGYAGLALGGRSTPGGLEVGGEHHYRLSDHDWLTSQVSFTLGRRGAACFQDRADETICDHGRLDGFAGDLGIGVRHHLLRRASMTPFFKLGVGVRVVSYAADELLGIAFPLVGGLGIRVRVAPHTQVVLAGEARAGLARFGASTIGGEPHISLTALGGIEFELH